MDRNILAERLHRRAILEARLDDANPSVIRHRLSVYDSETEATLKNFSAGLIEDIDVATPPVQILSAIGAALARRLV